MEKNRFVAEGHRDRDEECNDNIHIPGPGQGCAYWYSTHIDCLMTFNVKMDFTHKAQFIAGGHITRTPALLTYSSVVSQESVRIALIVPAWNCLEDPSLLKILVMQI